MVDTSLNRRYNADARQFNGSFEPVPEGNYTLKVKEVDKWKESKKTIKVILRDEDGKALVDEKGEKLTETVENCVFYNATVKFEIVGGEHDGRIIFHNLTTHPNMSFSISNFLYAIGMDGIAAGDIGKLCINKLCEGNVIISTYDRQVEDKDTGLTKTETKEKNEIKYLKKLPETNNEEYDLGI